MNRKQFIQSKKATCANWNWSWSFVNHEERIVIFGAWDYHAAPNSYRILHDDWEFSAKGRRQPGYSQAIEHVKLVRDEGYALMTFTMYSAVDRDADDDGAPEREKIGSIDEYLTLRTLKQVGKQYFAVELSSMAAPDADDTIDDLSGADYSHLGTDAPERFRVEQSHVRRDPAVRKKVVERAKNGCERSGCDDKRKYPGFLDVHHILGIEASDRVWTCVALCPNCHRESHFSPDRDQINRELLAHASQFKEH